MITIDKKITGWYVLAKGEKVEVLPKKLIEREPVLTGKTYKLKTPLSDHALYITINDLQGRPFEMFINSKSMESFQWTVALTRVISAVFRHGGEVNFLIEELHSVFDPKGGFFDKQKYVPSLVAAIGDILEQHLTGLGLYTKDTSLQEAAVVMLAEKQKENKVSDGKSACPNCHAQAVVMSGGCESCLECGWSRCS